MRPSKLRLPLNTLQTTRLSAFTFCEIACGNGPDLPMQVVQPYPTTSKFRASKYFIRPVLLNMSVATREPGASEVLTHGFTSRPFSTAFFATRPAASMSEGFEVFVQLVIAAITTDAFPTAPTASFASFSALVGASRSSTPPPLDGLMGR